MDSGVVSLLDPPPPPHAISNKEYEKMRVLLNNTSMYNKFT